jgi:hypothetical protein
MSKNYSNEVRVRRVRYGTAGGRQDGTKLSASGNKFAKTEQIARSEATKDPQKTKSSKPEKSCYTMVCEKSGEDSLRAIEAFERASFDAGQDYRDRKVAYDTQKAALLKEFDLAGKRWRSIDSDTRSYLLKRLAPFSFFYYEIQYVLVGENGSTVKSKTRRSTEGYIFDKSWHAKVSKRSGKKESKDSNSDQSSSPLES